MKYDENIHKMQHRCIKDSTLRLTYKMGPFDRENRHTVPQHRHTQDGGPPGSVQDERRCERRHPGVVRTLGSPEPLLAPNGPRFGGKIATAIPTSVPNVPIFVSHGNQPPWAIKGDSLTPHNTTEFGEKKEKGRVHLRAIL